MSAPVAATTGSGSPYNLGVSALLGKDGTTDVYATTTSSTSSVAAPSAYKELQLKSFDQDGVTVVYTKNFKDVAAPGGTADVQRTDLVRHQPLNVHALAQTAQTVSTQVVDAKAIVNLRPELKLENLQAPPTVYVNDHFTVSAVLAETNGDTGATSTVQILNGATAIDTIGSVSLAAGSQKGLAFDLSFATPGTYNLTMHVSNVAPGEWDTLYNTVNFTVVVIEPYKTLEYWASYDRFSRFYGEDTSYGQRYQEASDSESYNARYYTPDIATPGQPIHVKLGSDGTTKIDVQIAVNSYGYGCDHASGTCIRVSSYGGGTNIYLRHSAGVYSYSNNWCYWWGGCNFWYQYGTALGATQSVSAFLDDVTASGVHYGGTSTLAVRQTVNSSWDYTYNWWGYWYSWHDYGYYRQWWGYSSGTTTWN